MSDPVVLWLPPGVAPTQELLAGAECYATLVEAVHAALTPKDGLVPWLEVNGQTFDRRGIDNIREAAATMSGFFDDDRR